MHSQPSFRSFIPSLILTFPPSPLYLTSLYLLHISLHSSCIPFLIPSLLPAFQLSSFLPASHKLNSFPSHPSIVHTSSPSSSPSQLLSFLLLFLPFVYLLPLSDSLPSSCPLISSHLPSGLVFNSASLLSGLEN